MNNPQYLKERQPALLDQYAFHLAMTSAECNNQIDSHFQDSHASFGLRPIPRGPGP